MCDLPARHFWRYERDMAEPEMGLNYRIGGPPPYAVHLLAAARVILDAVVCLLPPIPRIWARARMKSTSR